LLLATSGPACLMTADPTLWQRHDASRDRGVDARRDLPQAEAHDQRSDAPGDGPAPDRAADLRADRAAEGAGDTLKPTPDLPCFQQQLTIAGPGDDGEIDNGVLLPSGEPPICTGYWIPRTTGHHVWGYFRFGLSKAIPKGATLTGATLALQGSAADCGGWNASTQALEVKLEDSADAPVVSAGKDEPLTGTGRTLIAGAVRWPTLGGLTWQTAGMNTSPSLASLLQSLVAKSTLASGSHVQLWIHGAQVTSGEVGVVDYQQPGFLSNPTRLTIAWCE